MIRALILSLAAGVMMFPADAWAQSESHRFETGVTISASAFQHGNSYPAWGSGWQVAVRQALFGVVFMEAEWSRVDARYHGHNPFVGGPTAGFPPFGIAQRYASVGGGVQWPSVAVLRPYAGMGWGKMTDKWNSSLGSSTFFVGVNAAVSSRVRPRVEFRTR